MAHFARLDVSVKTTSVCVVDEAGKVILEHTLPTKPAGIIGVASWHHRRRRLASSPSPGIIALLASVNVSLGGSE